MAKCIALDGIENADVSYSQDTASQGHYPEHTTATITCDEGYRISGNNITTCQNDGTWSSLASCESEPLSQLEILVVERGRFSCVCCEDYRATRTLLMSPNH